MKRLRLLVGKERDVEEVSRELFFYASSPRAPVVGGVHVTCADEAELECVNAFQHGFVDYLLPNVKFAHQSAFRLANLGGRYEWGAMRIAEEHFATPESRDSYKLLVVKVNAHVAVVTSPEGDRFGRLSRYCIESPCCGALDTFLHGGQQPYARELAEAFSSENKDRLAILGDPSRVDPSFRSLAAALVSSRLQARRAVLDIQDYHPNSPTLYLILPCVTLNGTGRDTEILCGIYTIDRRSLDARDEYFGLGDDPSRYVIEKPEGRQYVIEDDQTGKTRAARDHRELVLSMWRSRETGSTTEDGRLDTIRQKVARKKHHEGGHARVILKSLLPLLAEIAPIPAAILLFAHGIAGIHHAFRVHSLASDVAGSSEAQEVLEEIRQKIEQLDPAEARAIVELLLGEQK